MAHWNLGYLLCLSGRAEEAIPWIEKALDLKPLDPRNYVVMTYLALAKLCDEDYTSAVELADASMQQLPDYIDARMTLAAALAYLGRADEAQDAIDEFRIRAQDYFEDHFHAQ